MTIGFGVARCIYLEIDLGMYTYPIEGIHIYNSITLLLVVVVDFDIRSVIWPKILPE